MSYKLKRKGNDLEVHEHPEGNCATLEDVERLIHKQAELSVIDEVYLVSSNGARTLVDWRKRSVHIESPSLSQQQLNTPPRNTTLDPKLLSLIGVALLFGGVFAPLVRVPIVGTINYIVNGKGDGIFILALAFVAFIFALNNKFKVVMAMGICSLILMLITFINFSSAIADIQVSSSNKLANNLQAIIHASVGLEWGWAILLLGAAFMISAGVVSDK